jgi:hypothetical protein
MWKNIVEPCRPQVTIWLLRITCRITKATNTHSYYVILLDFPTTTMVGRTRLIVTVHVHCLYCYHIHVLDWSLCDPKIVFFSFFFCFRGRIFLRRFVTLIDVSLDTLLLAYYRSHCFICPSSRLYKPARLFTREERTVAKC